MTELQIKIKDKFLDYYLSEGKLPPSVFQFSKSIKMTEPDFYDEFGSFDAILQQIWSGFFTETFDVLKKQTEYQEFSVRDKLLTFHYSLIEVLKKNRSFILLSHTKLQKPMMMKPNNVLNMAKREFMEYAQELVVEGQENREIEPRLLLQLSNQYPSLLWRLTLSITEFWIKDTSRLFEKTDSLIEKSVNASMDLMGKTAFDSLFDLGKFMYQNSKK
jgi:Tetracyclin repressor-like, C-terminal domain